jgi:hypothetical protein
MSASIDAESTMPAYLEERRYELGATRCDRCWRRYRFVAH